MQNIIRRKAWRAEAVFGKMGNGFGKGRVMGGKRKNGEEGLPAGFFPADMEGLAREDLRDAAEMVSKGRRPEWLPEGLEPSGELAGKMAELADEAAEAAKSRDQEEAMEQARAALLARMGRGGGVPKVMLEEFRSANGKSPEGGFSRKTAPGGG